MKRIAATCATLAFFATTILSAQDNTTFATLCRERNGQTATLTDIAQTFVGTPYAAGTLDGDTTERLVARFDRFDCVTFVETALALWRSSLENWPAFTRELQRIRYRDGAIDGYASRLHYTTDWIDDNVRKGTVADITRSLGGTALDKRIDFMSRHADAYPALRNAEQLAAIRQTEDSINGRTHYFIPKGRVAEIDAQIPEGAVIAITSAIDGLDCAHIGIAVKRDGATHLLHASSRQKQVCISRQTLADYLASVGKFSGIIVVQPIK